MYIVLLGFLLMFITFATGGLFLIRRHWNSNKNNAAAGVIMLGTAVFSLFAILIFYIEFSG